MAKTTKLCLNLSKLCQEYCGFFFQTQCILTRTTTFTALGPCELSHQTVIRSDSQFTDKCRIMMSWTDLHLTLFVCVFLWFISSFFVNVCLSVTVKWLAVKTASKMTYTVSGEALNSTQSINQSMTLSQKLVSRRTKILKGKSAIHQYDTDSTQYIYNANVTSVLLKVPRVILSKHHQTPLWTQAHLEYSDLPVPPVLPLRQAAVWRK